MIEDVAVEIAHERTCGTGTHEAIERLAKKSGRSGNAHLVSEIASYGAAAGGRIVGLADAGEKEQSGIVESPGS